MIRLLAITPPAAIAGSIDPGLVDAWLQAGAAQLGLAVLLREPGAEAAAILGDPRLAALRRMLADRGVAALLSVDPRTLDPRDAAASLAHADPPIAGVQLRGDPSASTCARWREQLGPDATIGRSVHGDPTDADASPDGLDYTCLAPIWAPRTRLDGERKRPIGLDGLRRWAAVRDDLIALGGVTPDRAGDCLAAGARGVAGIRLFFGRTAEARQDVGALCRALAHRGDTGHGPAT